MARRRPPRKVTYFEPVAAAPCAQHRHRVDVRGRPPFPLHDARRLRPARSRGGDPAGTRQMAPAHARAPRRGGAGGLARRPQRGLSARRPDGRRTPRGRRRINPSTKNPGGGAGVSGGRSTYRQTRLSIVIGILSQVNCPSGVADSATLPAAQMRGQAGQPPARRSVGR